MKAIVAVDKNFGIGYKGKLLIHIPEDLKHFKKTTVGKVVVMGRQTFESLPGGLPLPDRTNIVLSQNPDFSPNNVIVCRSTSELFLELKKYSSDDIYVIGGGTIYKQLLPYCNEVVATLIDHEFLADTFFSSVHCLSNWRIDFMGEYQVHNGVRFRFINYKTDNWIEI